jgi:hypothetical protein
VSKIQCSRSGSCDTTARYDVWPVDSWYAPVTSVSQLNSYGLLGVGEGVDRTGLARVADAARNGPYGTGRVLTLEGIVVLNSLLRPEACEGLAQ